MPKKQFNLSSLANELEQSAFFPPRQSPTPIRALPAMVSEQPEPPAQNHVSTETRKGGTTKAQSSTSPAQPASVVPAAASASSTQPFHFDPNAKADQKYTLAFTEEELEIIEDIKLELRRRFGIKSSKVELVRCGLGDLVEDFQRRGDQSRLIGRLKSQQKHG